MRVWEVRDDLLKLEKIKKPLASDEEGVLKVEYVGICGSDYPKLCNPSLFSIPNNWRPGHEIVASKGGRLYVVDPLIPCGLCPSCFMGNIHLCQELIRIGWDRPGAFAEYIRVPYQNIHDISDFRYPEVGVLVDTAAVAIHALQCSRARRSKRLAVVGLGVLGSITALYARCIGFNVFGYIRNLSKYSKQLAEVLDINVYELSELENGTEEFDIVIDSAVGDTSASLKSALTLVGRGGQVLVLNAYHPGVELDGVSLRDIFGRSLELIGVFSYCKKRKAGDFEEALQFVSSHQEQLKYLLLPPEELGQLNAVLDRRMSGRRAVLYVT